TSRHSIFKDSGAAAALGSFAISRRTHFRARAACALLTRWCSRFLRAAVLSAFLAAVDPMRAERKTFEIRGHYLPVLIRSLNEKVYFDCGRVCSNRDRPRAGSRNCATFPARAGSFKFNAG